MTAAAVLDLAYQALMLVLLLSAPTVLVAAGVGLLVSLFQAVTQIQDQSIGSAAKFIAVTLCLIVTSGWMGGELYNFGERLFQQIPTIR